MGKLTTGDYVHLHNHTQYSLLDGLTKLPELFDFVKQSGMQSVAMTDHGTLSGAIDFYKTAKNNDIKPIIGIETYVAARKHTDKDPVKDKQRFHLILLAMNNTGYQNLMKLSTVANLEGYYYFPRVDHELLEQYSEGIIALSACMGGEVGDALKQGQYDKAKEVAGWYKKIFGDRYYLEIQDHGHPDNPLHNQEQQNINEQVIKLGNELDIAIVVTCDAHYLRHEDQEAHEVLLCVGTGAYLADEKRMSLKDYPLHVTEPQEIIDRWGTDHPEFITNTRAIADRCQIDIELGKILIPKFPVPKGETEKSYLHTLVFQGLARRYSGVQQSKAEQMTIPEAQKTLAEDVLKRANYELDVIDKMGFNGYFLIISDFINWGKDNGIVFGPGRGSAAGSIIAYGLRVTELDPLKYDLLFERFLNPDRISMPDVDIDIQDTRRDEVIQYCVEKYGEERVANIVTFGRMAARNAVRDTARVLQVPYAEADRLAKMIPAPVQGRHIPLQVSLKDDADLKREYETSETAKRVFDLAVQLEGTIRSHGIHAAGVVIAPDDIVKFAPLEKAQKGVISTQYSMGPVEELGLLKMDFLGLSNLTTIKNALRIIKRVYKVDIDIDNLPLDDEKTFELLQRGDTTGVFQLESAGMKRYLKELKPTDFEDIVAMVALYRPGPMQFIDDFIARKHGIRQIVYPHLSMENSLKNTYGVLVYQEQVMQISKEVCGFTGGEADTLRKAIGKKNAELMAKMKDKMIEGGQSHSGIDKALMNKFWKQLEDFAAYCFNKSHAACYGLIAYQTAYLKAHYPAAFMAALMTSDYDDTDRLAIEITECKHMGIEVLPPDVNESFPEFAVVPKKNQIRFGLNAIKNVGKGAVEEIIRARDEVSHFGTLEDFFTNVNSRTANKKAIESLIKSGAFDRMGNRLQLLENVDLLVAYASKVQKEANSGQTDLFGGSADQHVRATLTLAEAVSPYTLTDELQWERELLGLYLSQHPLESFKIILEETTIPINSLKPEHDGKTVIIGGSIVDSREITTKNGQKMAFVQLTDGMNEVEIIVFPRVFQQTLGTWSKDRIVLVNGKVSARDRDGNISSEVKIMADEAREITLEQAQAYQATGKIKKPPKAGSKKVALKTQPVSYVQKKLYIRLSDINDNDRLLNLKETLLTFIGETEVVLVLGSDASKQIVKLPQGINLSDDALDKMRALAGRDNIVIK
jgi:DNA polymerase-3 subunit alpha